MMRIGQRRLIPGLRRFGDYQGAAVVVARRDKTRRHIVAEERDLGAVDAVGKRQCTPGVIAIRRIAERGLCIECNPGQVDCVLAPQTRNRTCERVCRSGRFRPVRIKVPVAPVNVTASALAKSSSSVAAAAMVSDPDDPLEVPLGAGVFWLVGVGAGGS